MCVTWCNVMWCGVVWCGVMQCEVCDVCGVCGACDVSEVRGVCVRARVCVIVCVRGVGVEGWGVGGSLSTMVLWKAAPMSSHASNPLTSCRGCWS